MGFVVLGNGVSAEETESQWDKVKDLRDKWVGFVITSQWTYGDFVHVSQALFLSGV